MKMFEQISNSTVFHNSGIEVALHTDSGALPVASSRCVERIGRKFQGAGQGARLACSLS
jgi:hypothetical protein